MTPLYSPKRRQRKLPVIWAVAKGSFVNKLILVPGALTISAFVPALITPLLLIGDAIRNRFTKMETAARELDQRT